MIPPLDASGLLGFLWLTLKKVMAYSAALALGGSLGLFVLTGMEIGES